MTTFAPGPPMRALLAIAGAFILFTAVNVAFGGMLTLGLQGPRDFAEIADPAAFAAQDNHTRFLGGVWFGVGAVFVLAAIRPAPMRAPLLTAAVLIFVGGLARLSAPSALLAPSVIGSLFAELALAPALAWSLIRGARPGRTG